MLVLFIYQGAEAQRAYVPFTFSLNVGVLDTEARAQELLVDIDGLVWSAALSPTGLVAYVANYSAGEVIPIDTLTNTKGPAIQVGVAPTNITFSPDGRRAYISNFSSLSIIDTASGTVTETISSACGERQSPLQSVYSNNGLYFACTNLGDAGGPSTIRLMDISSLNISDVATVGPLSYNLALNETANRLYASSFEDNTVSVIDLSNNSVIATIGGSGEFNYPLGIGLASNDSILLVADYGDEDFGGNSNLNIIDTSTNTIIKTIDLGVYSSGLGVSSNGAVAYIVGRGEDAGIAVFDAASQTVVERISTTGTHSIAIWGDFLGNVTAQPPGLFNVGGTVAGLGSDKQLILQNNGADNLTLNFNGKFNFATGLQDGDSYIVTVSSQPDGQTCSVAGDTGVISGASIADIAVTCIPSEPAAPTNDSVTAGDAQLEVAFSAGADNGSAITNYEYSLNGSSFVALSPATTASPVVISGLANGTIYSVRLRAVNGIGAGAPSNSVAGTPVTIPGEPLQVKVTPGERSLNVSWVAPADNGGSPILRYRAESNPTCEVQARADEIPGETAYSCTITNVTAELEYVVTVVAISGAGEGARALAPAATRPLSITPVPMLSLSSLIAMILLMLTLPVVIRRSTT